MEYLKSKKLSKKAKKNDNIEIFLEYDYAYGDAVITVKGLAYIEELLLLTF